MEKNRSFRGPTKEEVAELFKDCHSNLDTPLMGRVRTPTCHDCKYFVVKKKSIDPFSCEVLGPLPNKYWHSDTEPCPYKVKKA